MHQKDVKGINKLPKIILKMVIELLAKLLLWVTVANDLPIGSNFTAGIVALSPFCANQLFREQTPHQIHRTRFVKVLKF